MSPGRPTEARTGRLDSRQRETLTMQLSIMFQADQREAAKTGLPFVALGH